MAPSENLSYRYPSHSFISFRKTNLSPISTLSFPPPTLLPDVSWENRSGQASDLNISGGGVEESGWSTPTSDLQASIPIAGSASSGTIPDIVKAQKRTASRSDKKKKQKHDHPHRRRSGGKGENKDATKAIVAKISEVEVLAVDSSFSLSLSS